MNNSTDHSSFFSILEGFIAKDYLPIDLSVSSSLFSLNQLNDSNKMANKIGVILKEKHKKIAYGGYLEKRALYKRSSLFQSDCEERNIHLGIDFWAKKATSVKCPEDGVIDSFAVNSQLGDYGPTIIIKHNNLSSINLSSSDRLKIVRFEQNE